MPIDTGDGTLDYTTDMQMQDAGDSGDSRLDYGAGGEGTEVAYSGLDAGMAVLQSIVAPTAQTGEPYMGNYGGASDAASSITPGLGAAPGLGNNWLSEGFGKALGWFDSQKDSTKGAAITLAGSFLKGLFSKDAANAKTKLKIEQQMADAATSRSNIEQQKMTNASSIAQTNFGAPKPGGLIFSNKLAGRQSRAGYGG